MTEWVILLVAGYVAATISGAAGFGGALLLLPVLSYTVGVKEAVPILTIAQLMGNLSRAWFGHSAIQWRPALAFSAGAVPASIIGARLFIELPSDLILRMVGVFLLGVVALRHTAVGRRPLPGDLLPVAGAIVGFLSALVGSAGPLGAAVFLSLQLPKVAYVASEAVTASLMHATKTVVYGRYSAITLGGALLGLALGSAMVLGSWTGRRLIDRMPDRWFSLFIEGMLVIAALLLVLGIG
jgi:uncharacterized membrane protein YfcA